MTFLHPAALWGLLALSVPIMVHFFNFQRPKLVLFSNVSFVKEIQQTVVRRVRFQQWLLLLFRLLALAGLVFAFSGPVLQQGGAELGASRSVVLIVDNSYSMMASDDRSEYFYQAVSRTRELVKALGRQDEILVMPTSDLKVNFPFNTQAGALESAQNLRIEQNLTSLQDILKLAPSLFGRASYGQKELFILGDFQQATFLPDSALARVNTDSSVRIRLIPIATRAQNNVFISDHRITSRILEKGKPVTLSLLLVNDGREAESGLNVRLMLGNKVAAISTTDVPAQGKRELDLTFTPDRGGWHAGFVEVDDPDVDFDNRRYFSFYVPEGEKILVVKGSPALPLDFLLEALGSQFEITSISEREIANVNLGQFRAMALSNVNTVQVGAADKIAQFVKEGGNLLLFPGPEADISSINLLLAALEAGAFASAQNHPEGLEASQAELSHPVFDGVFQANQTRRKIDPPKLYKVYPHTLGSGTVRQTILATGSGLPFLTEVNSGNGTAYLFTAPIQGSWTDFQVKTLFAPLVFRVFQVMSQPQQVENNQEIGSLQTVRLQASGNEMIELVDENGQTFLPEQYARGGTVFLNFEQTELQEGNFTLRQGATDLQRISFNISDEESRLRAAKPSEISAWLSERGVRSVDILTESQEAILRRIQTEQEGAPLWKYFLIFALAFLIAEAVMLGWGAFKFRQKPALQR